MTQATDYNNLFQEYIAVCNKALEKCAKKFPFNRILESAQETENQKIVEVRIIDDYSIPLYRLKIQQNKVTTAACSPKGGGCCNRCVKGQWLVQAGYLKQVVNNADKYIDNPALINWEWLHNEAA